MGPGQSNFTFILLTYEVDAAITSVLKTRRLNQSVLKEYSLEGLMLKPKLQYFGHLMRRAGSLEKNLKLGKIEGTRRSR